MRKKVLLLIFLVSLLLTACEKGEYEEVVFQDEVITDRQIQIYKQRNRADIIAKYQKDGEQIDESFWGKEIENKKTVKELLMDKALRDCLYDQAILCEAEKHGLIEDASFSEIENALETVNQSNKTERLIYGNKFYTLDTYVTYYLNNLTRELIDVLSEDELYFTNEELAKYCKENEVIEKNDKIKTYQEYRFQYKNILFRQYITEVVENAMEEILCEEN